MFFQCCTNPCARAPATMIAKNVMVASAAVTLKLPVAVMPDVAAHDGGDDDEQECRDQPQHQYVLGDREVHAQDLGQVDQWVVDGAVRDVLDDDFTGVEAFAGSLGGVFGFSWNLQHAFNEDVAGTAPASRTTR